MCPQGSPIDVCGLVVMSVETLGEAHAYGWRITARCAGGKQNGMHRHPECRYREELDTGTLVWTRGKAFPLLRLETVRAVRCAVRA
jgi:hypothetical protein